VDSAVAAARLVAAGHEVTGVHMALSRSRPALRSGSRGCCSIEDSRDAWRAADRLGIPFYVWDLSEQFTEAVVADFLSEYAAGRTPNPCLRCNETIKFAHLLDEALALGFDAVATGHYARLVAGPDGVQLHRAVDTAKDQSYVLGVLTSEQLARSLFPLGDTPKELVRREAAQLGLQVADKPDSNDICFIPDGDTAGFLRAHLPAAPGDIRDCDTGEVLGTHAGAYQFTVGQRRGLAIGTPAPDGSRRYVTEVDLPNRTVWVGPVGRLRTLALECDHARWCGPVPQSGLAVGVQVRAHGNEYPATLELTTSGFGINFDEAIPAVAAGQSAVLYQGTRVLGSGTVRKAIG
jgi:tRNA-specific 2-thiouridylase